MSDVAALVIRVLAVFCLGLAVRIFAVRSEQVVYPVALVLVGLIVAITPFELGIRLSRDIIMIGLLPIILFQGAAELDLDQLRETALPPLLLVIPGLPLTAAILGGSVAYLLELPLLVGLLFGAIIVPTDPAAVLAIFQQLDAPEDLESIIKGESVFNDFVAIVLFTVLVDLVETQEGTGQTVTELTGLATIRRLLVEMLVVGGGGLFVGLLVGFVGNAAIRWVRDRQATLLITVIAAYGSYLIASQVIGISGVLAAVTAGLVIGHTGGWDEEPTRTVEFMKEVWQTAVFLVNTLLYILIGELVAPGLLLDNAVLVSGAVILVLVARGVVVYPLMSAANRVLTRPVPRKYQHVIVWGSLHTVIPVALALSLSDAMQFSEEIRAMVFGVAVLSVGIQGLLMPTVLKYTGTAS
ncbi:cation:proton antiporter [Natronosalvus caseinilyticus]|uniref:cation:proton antiporter n=1 Tax=Natronosalvus caseinilyticus TaxID=2953747 RepID=UPI0028ADD16B|nr:cation:proton antiporter [Natronosalvus caseinilyticus]